MSACATDRINVSVVGNDKLLLLRQRVVSSRRWELNADWTQSTWHRNRKAQLANYLPISVISRPPLPYVNHALWHGAGPETNDKKEPRRIVRDPCLTADTRLTPMNPLQRTCRQQDHLPSPPLSIATNQSYPAIYTTQRAQRLLLNFG